MIIRDRDDGGGGFANGMLLGTGLGLMAGKCISRTSSLNENGIFPMKAPELFLNEFSLFFLEIV